MRCLIRFTMISDTENEDRPTKKQKLDPLGVRIERHKASFDPACEPLLKLNDSELKQQIGEQTEGLGQDRSKLGRLKATDPAAAHAKWSAAHSEAGRVVEELRRQLRDAERKQEEARRELDCLDTLEETEREIDALEAKLGEGEERLALLKMEDRGSGTGTVHWRY